ncbi:MAG TPA: phosphate ABC transporter substrate-binding protein [Candidatus Faecousia intestinigallinarum]|nr:phosphate ABC transporter substrate-binding protein [Candidatus Faecousia intestinigallinarum]
MKKILALALSAILLVGLLAACAPKEAEKVSTDGSTSMEKLMEILREVYKEETGVEVTYNPTGSGAGIEAVQSGRCDIGLASRDLKPEEEESGLQGTVVAIDGIAVVVNPENPVSDLTVEQIAKLYTGEITNWSEVGGNDAPVVLIGREAASGTRDGFESITGTEDACKYNQELTSTGDVIATVAGNPNAIGYASLSAVDEKIKAISVNGVAPSNETVQNGTYAVQRNFVLVTKADGSLSEAAQKFFEFATSAAADEYILQAGAVPVIR